MKHFLTLLLMALLCSCHNSDPLLLNLGDTGSDFEELMEIPATQQPPNPRKGNVDQMSKKVIKTGGIEFRSEDIEADYSKVMALLPGFGAYVGNESQETSSHEVRYHMTIRVPAAGYDSLYASIARTMPQLVNRHSNTQDVTTRYYDLETRIKNSEALEQRYLELLQKAVVIKDILEIEQNLSELRTEIEQLQGQFNYLSKQIGYSTINLSFYELLPYEYETSSRKGFGARVLSALDGGWQGFLAFLVVLASLWPLFILLPVGALVIRRWRRHRAERKKAE